MDRDIHKLLQDIQRTVSDINKRQIEMDRSNQDDRKTYLEIKNLLRGIDKTTKAINHRPG